MHFELAWNFYLLAASASQRWQALCHSLMRQTSVCNIYGRKKMTAELLMVEGIQLLLILSWRPQPLTCSHKLLPCLVVGTSISVTERHHLQEPLVSHYTSRISDRQGSAVRPVMTLWDCWHTVDWTLKSWKGNLKLVYSSVLFFFFFHHQPCSFDHSPSKYGLSNRIKSKNYFVWFVLVLLYPVIPNFIYLSIFALSGDTKHYIPFLFFMCW